VLRGTETTFEFGAEGLYERLATQSGTNVYPYCQPDAIEFLSAPAPCMTDTPGCIREESSTRFGSEKGQLVGITRLRMLHGTLRPYAESSVGVYYASSRDQGSVVYTGAESGTSQWDFPSSSFGLLLGLGAGLELPVGDWLALLFVSRLHAQIGDEAARLTPTFGRRECEYGPRDVRTSCGRRSGKATRWSDRTRRRERRSGWRGRP
jgi:hypothetical protein